MNYVCGLSGLKAFFEDKRDETYIVKRKQDEQLFLSQRFHQINVNELIFRQVFIYFQFQQIK